MEVALGLVGLGLSSIAVISAYIWGANGRYIKMLREEIAQDTKILQQAQMESARVLQEGQRELMQGIRVLQEGQKEIAQSIEKVVQGIRVLQGG